MKRRLASGCFLLCASAAEAQERVKPPVELEAPENKTDYTLFNPTPPGALRPLSTDRPDKTESPYTIDAGHLQVELDFATYTRDHDTAAGRDMLVETLNVTPVNLKLGLTNDTDVQIVFESYIHQTISDAGAGARQRTSGVGDVTIRLKHNFWGNDGGANAFALMPFVTLPANSNGLGAASVEGGLIAPLAIALPGQFGLGLMTEIDLVRNAGETGYTARFVNSATISHDLTNSLGMYVEVFTETARRELFIATFDAGLTYAIGANTQLDGGVNLGITRAADDVEVFIGLSRRF